MKWLEYLHDQRAEKMRQIDALETGKVQLFEAVDGVTRETTAERLTKLKSDVAEIRRIFIEEGVPTN